MNALTINSLCAQDLFSTLHLLAVLQRQKLALTRSDSCLCGRFAAGAGVPEKYPFALQGTDGHSIHGLCRE
jgi:hypothetical protein